MRYHSPACRKYLNIIAFYEGEQIAFVLPTPS